MFKGRYELCAIIYTCGHWTQDFKSALEHFVMDFSAIQMNYHYYYYYYQDHRGQQLDPKYSKTLRLPFYQDDACFTKVS